MMVPRFDDDPSPLWSFPVTSAPASADLAPSTMTALTSLPAQTTGTETGAPSPTRRELHTGWTVRAVAGPVPAHLAEQVHVPVPASVPGTVHTDLLAAGIVPDPYLDDNEHVLAWICLLYTSPSPRDS